MSVWLSLMMNGRKERRKGSDLTVAGLGTHNRNKGDDYCIFFTKHAVCTSGTSEAHSGESGTARLGRMIPDMHSLRN